MVDAWDPEAWGLDDDDEPAAPAVASTPTPESPQQPVPGPTRPAADDDLFDGLTANAAAAALELDRDDELAAILPSGDKWELQTRAEVEFATRLSSLYAEQFGFENISDIADVDQIVRNETLLFRWDRQTGSGVGPTGAPLKASEIDAINRLAQAKQTENRQLKRQLQVAASSRQSGKGSPAEWFELVLDSALAHEIHRHKHHDVMREACYDLIGRVQFVKQATADEQRMVGIDEDGLLDYLMGDFEARIISFDELYQEEEQSAWVDEL